MGHEFLPEGPSIRYEDFQKDRIASRFVCQTFLLTIVSEGELIFGICERRSEASDASPGHSVRSGAHWIAEYAVSDALSAQMRCDRQSIWAPPIIAMSGMFDISQLSDDIELQSYVGMSCY